MISKWETLWLGFSGDKQPSPPVFPVRWQMTNTEFAKDVAENWICLHSLQRDTGIEIKVRGKTPLRKVVDIYGIFLSPIFSFTSLPSLCHGGEEGLTSLISSKNRFTSRQPLRLVLHTQELVEYNCYSSLVKFKGDRWCSKDRWLPWEKSGVRQSKECMNLGWIICLKGI